MHTRDNPIFLVWDRRPKTGLLHTVFFRAVLISLANLTHLSIRTFNYLFINEHILPGAYFYWVQHTHTDTGASVHWTLSINKPNDYVSGKISWNQINISLVAITPPKYLHVAIRPYHNWCTITVALQRTQSIFAHSLFFFRLQFSTSKQHASHTADKRKRRCTIQVERTTYTTTLKMIRIIVVQVTCRYSYERIFSTGLEEIE